MPTIPNFDPPGELADFDDIPNQRAAWDEFIQLNFQRNIESVESEVGGGRCQFFDPKKTQTDADAMASVIRWKGFPLAIAAQHPGNKKAAWQQADLRPGPGVARVQDEYLEWFVTRQGDKITRVVFTCEGPEYWEALANGYPRSYTLSPDRGGLGGTKRTAAIGDQQKLLQLYRELVSPNVQLTDLLDASGRYNRLNKWNTSEGAVHLTHRANTLGAEINIAAQATILRQDKAGQLINDADALIECAKFGAAERASDPHIGDEVNKLARQGFAITLQNPVGLYIDELDTMGWTTPDGTPAAQFFKRVRGGPGTTVRAVFEVPEQKGYTVSDIKIGGLAIQFGGQIAERVTIKLTGIACREGSFDTPPVGCVVPQAGAVAAVGTGDVFPSRR